MCYRQSTSLSFCSLCARDWAAFIKHTAWLNCMRPAWGNIRERRTMHLLLHLLLPLSACAGPGASASAMPACQTMLCVSPLLLTITMLNEQNAAASSITSMTKWCKDWPGSLTFSSCQCWSDPACLNYFALPALNSPWVQRSSAKWSSVPFARLYECYTELVWVRCRPIGAVTSPNRCIMLSWRSCWLGKFEIRSRGYNKNSGNLLELWRPLVMQRH